MIIRDSLVNQLDYGRNNYETTCDDLNIQVERKPWGIYQVLALTTIHSAVKDTLQTHWLTIRSRETDAPNLMVSDLGLPVQYAGHVKLEGKIELPERSLVNGRLMPKTMGVPSKLVLGGSISKASERLASIPYGFQLPDINSESGISTRQLSDDVINHSFKLPTLGIQAYEVDLHFKSIKENVILTSDKPIRLPSTLKLEDVIVRAPSINVETGFTGSGVQLYATDSIILSARVRLSGRSSVYLDAGAPESKVYLGEGTYLEGHLIVKNNAEELQPPKVYMGSNTVIVGELMTEGVAFLSGNIEGTAIAHSVGYKDEGDEQLNVIRDFTLTRPDDKSMTSESGIVKKL